MAPDGSQERTEGAPVADIVLIHGIAAEHSSANSLLAQWLPALAGGVANAGYPELAKRIQGGQISAEMAFYGDLFQPRAVFNPAAVSSGLDGAPAPGRPGTNLVDQFTESFAEMIVKRAADPPGGTQNPDTSAASAAVDNAAPAGGDGSVAAGFDGSAFTAGHQNYFLQQLDKLPWIKQKIFGIVEDAFFPALKQVGVYLTDPEIHNEIQERVEALVTNETQIIIGHSLGSVVAFDFVTHHLAQTLPLLLTLGSPLGDKTLVYKKLVPQLPVYPPKVKEWMNISARNDPVAANPDLVPDYGNVPQGCQLNSGWTVINQDGNTHAIVDYLNQKEVGNVIASVYNSAQATPTGGS